MKAEAVQKIIVYLYGVIAELQAKLAEALGKPAVGQEELDAAIALAEEYRVKAEEYKGKYESVKAEDEVEESVLDGIISDFQVANPDVVIE